MLIPSLPALPTALTAARPGSDPCWKTTRAGSPAHALPVCVVLPLLLALLLAGCGDPPIPPEGEFSMLTYNVAALPQGLSSSDPERTIPLISPHLNAWDLVVVQEDFAFQRELREDIELPFQSYPKESEGLLGDGLNRFSSLEFDLDVERVRWTACNGLTGDSNDCLAEKGFSVAQHRLDDDHALTVVNLHMDAGGGEDNAAARMEQVEQMIAHLNDLIVDGPLVVAGDTNTRPSRDDADDAAILERLKEGLAVEDACVILECGEEDRIDRILLRSTEAFQVEPLTYRIADELVDEDGEPLSDHEAIEVVLRWSADAVL